MQAESRDCLEEVAGYWKKPSWFHKIRAVWEAEQAGVIEQGSEKRRLLCMAYGTVRE